MCRITIFTKECTTNHVHKLLVGFEYTSRGKNLNCVAIVAHRKLPEMRYRFYFNIEYTLLVCYVCRSENLHCVAIVANMYSFVFQYDRATKMFLVMVCCTFLCENCYPTHCVELWHNSNFIRKVYLSVGKNIYFLNLICIFIGNFICIFIWFGVT